MPENASIDRIKRRGRLGELYVTSFGPVVTGKNGVAAGDVDYFVSDYELAFELAPRVGLDKHPRFDQLLCQESTINYVKPGAARISSRYEGAGHGQVNNEGVSRSIDIEVTPSLRELPIEAHEKFDQWKQYAVYDDNGQFIGWNIPEGAPAAKWFTQDMTSYLEPTVTLRRSYTSTSTPNLGNLRRIYSSIPGAPSVSPRNWLLMSLPYRLIGEGLYSVTEEYMLSGVNGWNPYVYGSASV